MNNNRMIATPLVELTKPEQTKFLTEAARHVEPRSVKGSSKGRFYLTECDLNPRAAAALRDLGHGTKVMTGSGSNSGRWYFPLEILEIATRNAKRAAKSGRNSAT